MAVPEPRDPKTPAQMEGRQRVRIASRAWAKLTSGEMRGWSEYADLAAAAGLRSVGGRPLRPYDLMCGLACKWMQIHGSTAFPTAAPEGLFLGDALTVRAEGTSRAVVFRANGSNGPLALTELMLQPLANPNRKPQADKYRTRGFVAFVDGALETEVKARPGAFAVGARYLLETTGQASRIVPLGIVVVGS